MSKTVARILNAHAPVNKCRVDVGGTHIRCRACGAFMARDGLTDLCGPINPRYCANCGRRIEWGDAG